MGLLTRGLAAGAVGTTVLDAVTYADMVATGRSASDAPGRTVLAVADKFGVDLPSDGGRPDAYGALAGAGTGLGIALVAGGLRSAGLRLPLLAEAAVVGVGAMLATDGPMSWAGVTTLQDWSGVDWARDVVPHLAYGLAVSSTLRALEPADPYPTPTPPARVLGRSLALGLATGARSSLGLVPSALGSGRSRVVAAALGLVVSELTVDKLPVTSSRLAPAPLLGRLGLGAVGAVSLARQHSRGVLGPALVGAVGAVVGSFAGAVFRDVAATRGWTWQAAALEDGAALALTTLAYRGTR